MKYATFIAAVAAALSSKSVMAWAPEGYGESAMDWVFHAPDGSTVRFEGTAEEATKQFETKYPGHHKNHTRQWNNPWASKRADLVARQWEGANYECIDAKQESWGWKPASYQRISEGWNHLWSIEGKPGNGPGPGNCGRVSCSYNSAIYWCNDNPTPKTLDSYATLARGAAELCNLCSSAGIRDKCGGQIFHPEGYNVIIREDKC